MHKFAALLMLLLVCGCAPMKTANPSVDSGAPSSTVLVYREWAYNSGGPSMYFGEGGSYYLSLRNLEYSEGTLNPGKHLFVVTTRGSQDFSLQLDLSPGSRTCLKAYADPANYAKMIAPLLMNLTSLFKLETVACPGSSFLDSYTKVPKT